MTDTQNPSAERIAAVRDCLSEWAAKPPPPPVRGGSLLRRVPRWVPGLVRVTATRLVRPRSKRRAAVAQRLSPLRLHIGCGWLYKEDWVNIDLSMTRADFAWDLRTGIPFETGSVDAVFHEHLLEHLPLVDGYALTRECFRVLKPGGILRIGVPDAGDVLGSYAGTNDSGWTSEWPTGMLAVLALFYGHDHRAMYDAETLILMCRAAGFASAERRGHGEGWLQPSPDTPEREGSLYVEGRKGSDDDA